MLALALALALAQDPRPAAPVTIEVEDATGAPVARATVVISEDETATVTATPGRLPGEYEALWPEDRGGVAEAHAPGFLSARATFAPAGESSPSRRVALVLVPATLSDTITVRAPVTAPRGLDRPGAVSFLARSDLTQGAPLMLDDALRGTPGFSLFRRNSSRTANPTTQGVTLRGLSASGASRTLVLADGVPLNDPFGGWVHWGRLPAVAVERVTVLRGAASDLFGADAAGGVVQVVSAQPDGRVARASAEGGTLGTGRISAYAGSGRRHLRLWGSGEWFSTDGYVPVAEAERGPIDTRAGVEHLVLNGAFAAAGERWHTIGRVSVFTEDRTNGTPLQTNDTNGRQVSAEAGGIVWGGAWEARAHGGWQGYDQSFSAISGDRRTETLTQRQRVPATFAGASGDWTRGFGQIVLLAGTDARWVDGESQETRFVAGVPLEATTSGGSQRTAGVYGQAQWRPVDPLAVTVGARLDSWKSTASGEERTEWFGSPRLTVAWQLRPGISLRGTVADAYRTPTLNELHRAFRVGGTVTLANPDLGAERLRSVEGSLWLSRSRGAFRATVFTQRLADAIANVTVSVTPVLITRQRMNAGTVRASGAELEGEWRVLPVLRATGSAAFTRSTFDEPREPGLEGNRVPQVPRIQIGAALWYTGPIEATLQARYLGAQYEDDRNQLRLGPAALFDAFAACELVDGVFAFFAVENLLDREYDSGLTPVLTTGLPRTLRAGVRVHWP